MSPAQRRNATQREFCEEDTQAENISLELLGSKLGATGFEPAFIGITATTSIINQALETARICKRSFPAARIALGGVHPSIFPDEALSNTYVDFVIRREGEESFFELVSGKPPESILGLSYRSGGNIVHNKDRDEIPDINTLPLPAYDVDDYENHVRQGLGITMP